MLQEFSFMQTLVCYIDIMQKIKFFVDVAILLAIFQNIQVTKM